MSSLDESVLKIKGGVLEKHKISASHTYFNSRYEMSQRFKP